MALCYASIPTNPRRRPPQDVVWATIGAVAYATSSRATRVNYWHIYNIETPATQLGQQFLDGARCQNCIDRQVPSCRAYSNNALRANTGRATLPRKCSQCIRRNAICTLGVGPRPPPAAGAAPMSLQRRQQLKAWFDQLTQQQLPVAEMSLKRQLRALGVST